MTADNIHAKFYGRRPTARLESTRSRDLQQPVRPRWTSRLWSAVRSAIYGFDAAALITHGAEVPANHPARKRPGVGRPTGSSWHSPGD